MNRHVKYVRFQSNVFVPVVGDLGNVIPTPGKTLQPEVSAGSIGVTLKIKGHEILIPWPNVQLVTLGDEIVPTEKASKGSK